MSILRIFLFLILLIGFIGFLISLKNHKEWIKELDKKEHKLYFLYPLVDIIFHRTRLDKYLNQRTWIREAGKALTVANKVEDWQKIYWYRKISLVMVILYLFFAIAFLSQIGNGMKAGLWSGTYLSRPDFGEGDREVHLTAIIDSAENSTDNNERTEILVEDMVLRVEERSYKKEDLEKLFQNSFEYLEIAVLGENQSPEAIYSDLIFYRNVPSTSILVDWQPVDPNLIDRNGTVRNEKLPKNGINTKVNLILS